jgi:hypothetical protein
VQYLFRRGIGYLQFSGLATDRNRIAVGNIVRIAVRRLERSEIGRNWDLAPRPVPGIVVPIGAGDHRRALLGHDVSVNIIL